MPACAGRVQARRPDQTVILAFSMTPPVISSITGVCS
jgi:hypothetical protein